MAASVLVRGIVEFERIIEYVSNAWLFSGHKSFVGGPVEEEQ